MKSFYKKKDDFDKIHQYITIKEKILKVYFFIILIYYLNIILFLMNHYDEANEEKESINERYTGDKGFEKVPIEDSQNNSIEIYNVYTGLEISKGKCKKRVYNILIIVLIAIIIIMLKKILDITNIINEDSKPVLNNDYIQEHDPSNQNEFNNYDDEENEIYYLIQKKEKINMSDFSSPQLRNPDNIKIIPKLEISLDLEYDKFVHLKIKDAENERWEVPDKDVLDEEYYLNRNDNKVPITKSSSVFDSHYFYIELLSNNASNKTKKDIEEEDPDNINDIDMANGIDENEFENKKNLSKEIREDFGFRIMTSNDEEFFSFTTTKNFIFSDTYINFESKLTTDKIYGFGERTHDFHLNEGTYTIWPHDCGGTKYDDGQGGMNEYSHQPIGLHKTKFNGIWIGFVFLNTNAQDVVIHSDKNNTYLTHRTIGGIIDYYIIVNESPEEVIKSIQTLLGFPPLPPFWSLGYHQSRYGYKSFNDFKEVYEKYKSLEIPIDGMWLDIDALENFEMFTINKKFKPIEPYIAGTIHKDGAKFIPIVDIGFSYENKENKYIKYGDELDIFIKSNYTKENLIGKVWPGKTVFPDFFHPNISEFWNKGLEDYYNLVKYDGIWLDMNEPANLMEDKNKKCFSEIADEKECTPDKNKYDNDELPYIPGYRRNMKEKLSLKSISENALIYGNNTVYDTKPLISFYQTKYTYNYLKMDLSKRPFILSRSTTLGSGKYTFHWLGDNLSTFENLKNSVSGLFNFNIFGIPFSGSDICGFMQDATKELCIRWYNLGAFYPFSRNHNFFVAKDQYPWSFDSDTIDIIKKNIKLRYSLLRYFYSQFFLISINEKGSFFKPLMFEFPDEESSFDDIESKILVGEAFLLCAFFENNENSKKFTFPNSNFNYYPSGKILFNYVENESKKNIIELPGKLDQIHLFLRGGFIVPYQNLSEKYISNTEKLRQEKINLIVNIDNYNQSKGELFFDDDKIDTVSKDLYFRVEMFYNEKKLTFTTYKNNLDEYNYNDHILGKIEFWRISNIVEMNNKKENKTKAISLNITYNDNKEDNIEGIYDQENDKVIFEISKDERRISIFNINELIIN